MMLYVRHGPQELHDAVRKILNNSVEEREELAVGIGVLVSLPKPNKTKGPVKHLR